MVKNVKISQSDHFVMGLAHVKNAKIFQNGEKCEWFFKVVENVNDLSVNSVSFLDLKNQ
jgi:hypothetical protein